MVTGGAAVVAGGAAVATVEAAELAGGAAVATGDAAVVAGATAETDTLAALAPAADADDTTGPGEFADGMGGSAGVGIPDSTDAVAGSCCGTVIDAVGASDAVVGGSIKAGIEPAAADRVAAGAAGNGADADSGNGASTDAGAAAGSEGWEGGPGSKAMDF